MAHNLTSVFAFEYCFLFQWLLLALTFFPEHNRWQWPREREREKDGKTELKKMQAKTHNVKIFQNSDTVHTHKFSLYRKEKLFHRVHENRSRICIIRQSNCSAFDRESLYLCIFFDVVPFHSIPFHSLCLSVSITVSLLLQLEILSVVWSVVIPWLWCVQSCLTCTKWKCMLNLCVFDAMSAWWMLL